MRKERIKQLVANPEFIPGIYNYCDSWCDRCPFTAHCSNFALSEEQFAEPGSRDIRNKLFWRRLSEMLRLTRALLEDTLKEKGIALKKGAIEAAEKRERLTHARAENHSCAQAAKLYGQFVDTWLDSAEESIEETRSMLKTQVRTNRSNISAVDEAAGFEDIFKILHWYQHQIYVKLMRAISGQLDEDVPETDEFPKDSDGSAKVALIGIDRSIAAWMKLRDYLPDYKDDLIDLLLHLDRLRKSIEKHFPDARAFIRPGFDEVDSL